MPLDILITPLEERFLKKCVATPCKIKDFEDCWIWTGAKQVNGYSQILKKIWGGNLGHQWACHHWNGSPLPVEKGMCVKHKCDTRLCVNPAHLEYGTLQENIKEMVERNPTAMGRIVPTDEELKLLRQMIADNTPRREKARRLGHSRHWVDRIMREYFPDAN